MKVVRLVRFGTTLSVTLFVLLSISLPLLTSCSSGPHVLPAAVAKLDDIEPYEGETDSDRDSRAIRMCDEAIRAQQPTAAQGGVKPSWLPFFIRAEANRDREEYDAALADYDRAIALNTQAADAYGGRAEAYRGLNQNQQSKQDFDKAISMRNSADFYAGRACLFNDLGDLDNELADWKAAVALDPDNVYRLIQLGDSYLFTNRVADAIKSYKIALQKNDEDEEATAHKRLAVALAQSGDVDNAIKEYDLSAAKGDTPVDYAESADFAALNGRDQAARKMYLKAIDAFKKQIAAGEPDIDRGVLAHCYRRIGSKPQAQVTTAEAVNDALQSADEEDQVLEKVATLYDEAGMRPEALKWRKQLLQKCEEAARGTSAGASDLHDCGEAKYNLAMYKEALKDFSQAAQLDSANADYPDHIAACNMRLGQTEMAIKALSKSNALPAGHQWSSLAEAFERRGDHAKAAEAAAKAKLYEVLDGAAYYWHGRALQGLHRNAEAQQQFDRATMLDYLPPSG